ncbi:IclR family transcriptional regulator [Cellulosimicrobium arenosum]|uniref:Glycerol operon regulatory protein n=1 Tax=Cellulosimicrobium arenosum TaxID=2708133 RepID=A0A927J239_9MICO|nr:IclR family transcriptional regulator [Cellulosimicrobium arenosum]MBD8080467.1 IclR family transcriptional regulator [Cellulosimicrobium arenosum]
MAPTAAGRQPQENETGRAGARSGGVQSVDRAIELLELLADFGGESGLSELAQHTGLPLPTIHRLLRTLVAQGYVRQTPNRRYTLGPRLIRLGESAGRQLGAGARPHLERLAVELGESANLAMIDRDMAVYVAQASSQHSMRMFTEVGRRVYTHCTGVGKAVLSQLPDQTVREIVARVGMPPATDLSITDVDALLADLAATRERGYAIDDGEQELGVRCFAVPVPGTPTPTALSVSGPAARVTYEFGERAVPVLQRVAAELTRELVSTAP